MKIFVLLILVFIMQGCFVLTRDALVVNQTVSDKTTLATTVDSKWISQKTFFPNENGNEWAKIKDEKSWQVFGQLQFQQKAFDDKDVENFKGFSDVDIQRFQFVYSKNPLRYLLTPFTVVADVVLDFVTLGEPMAFVDSTIKQRERIETSILIKEK